MTDNREWNNYELDELIDNILERFHNTHREDLQFLIPLADKVESVHADTDNAPKGLASFLRSMLSELENHMQKEEQILFPMIKNGQGAMAQGPIHVMQHEHVDHQENLDKLKETAHGYVLPEGACGSWTTLYQRVEKLENDLRQHIQIENEILFPKALNG